jgi:hypothetical protein
VLLLFCALESGLGFVDEVFCGGDDDGESVDGLFSCLFCFDYGVDEVSFESRASFYDVEKVERVLLYHMLKLRL